MEIDKQSTCLPTCCSRWAWVLPSWLGDKSVWLSLPENLRGLHHRSTAGLPWDLCSTWLCVPAGNGSVQRSLCGPSGVLLRAHQLVTSPVPTIALPLACVEAWLLFYWVRYFLFLCRWASSKSFTSGKIMVNTIARHTYLICYTVLSSHQTQFCCWWLW